jgi:tRNA-dihydrouridine synthase
VRAIAIPVCGNGGVTCHRDLAAMRERTGCRYVMVGRAALADPWIFSGIEASAGDAARFLLEYGESLEGPAGFPRHAAVARVKQLLRFWTAGGLCEPDRSLWLREPDPDRLLARLRSLSA